MRVYALQERPAPLSILSTRGLACLLLVSYHVVGSDPNSGLHLPVDSRWHYAMESVEFLRMPVFSVLSGYLYAMRRPTRETVRAFAWGKVRRIVAPLIFATLVTFWLRAAVYGPDVTLAYALLHHYEHFWFLQSLLVIFIVMTLWDLVRSPDWSELLVVSFCAVMLGRSIGITDFLSLNGAFYLLPYFCCGMILRLEPHLLERADIRFIAASVLFVVVAAQQSGMLFGTTAVLRNSVPSMLAGYAVSLLLMIYLPSLKLLKVIGRFSYGIYIWHSIFAAGVRTGLNSVFTLPIVAQFPVILIAGILCPIVLQLFVDRIPVLSTLMMGSKRPMTSSVDSKYPAPSDTTSRQAE